MAVEIDEAVVNEQSQEKLFAGNLPVQVGLERIRKRLLDLTRRNKLLNFHNLTRQTKSARLLRAIDTSPNELFQEIYVASKNIDILPIPEASKKDWAEDERGMLRKPDVKKQSEACGINTSYDLDDSGDGSVIRALLYPEDLEGTLRKIDQAYRTSIEEAGTNILHLVFGFVEWYDSDDSDKPMLSPLMVLPINIKKGSVDQSNGFFRYSIEHSGEDLTENITLRQKLKVEFGLELPPMLDEDIPETYFERIEEFIKSRHRWQVKRQICVCLLSFGKLLMYLDLDPARWPANSNLASHATIKALFEGTDREEAHSFATELNIDENQKALAIPLVYDADSSQHSALVDALNNRNLVIEGPPGTGKSQTITNLIASKLADGKTVLFISEKLAALEVVRRNLDRAKLGKFCLELHSHKTQKRKFLNDIKARRESHFPDPSELDQKILELEDKRIRLRRYVHMINAIKENQLGKTVHEILWASDRYRSQLGDKSSLVSGIAISDAPSATLVRLSEQSDSLNQFGRHLVEIGDWGVSAPWHGYTPYQLLFGDDTKVGQILQGIIEATDQLEVYLVAHEKDIGTTFPRDEATEKVLIDGVAKIPNLTGLEAVELLPAILSADNREAFIQLKTSVKLVNNAASALSVFRNHEDISEKDIALIAEIREKAHRLSQVEVPYPALVTRGSQVLTVASRLKDALPIYEQVGKTLNIGYSTYAEVEIVRKIIGVVAKVPTELLDLRRQEWFEPSALHVIQEGKKAALALRDSRQTLLETFALSALPERTDIVQALSVFVEGGGAFRIFKSDWRKSAKLYSRIRLGKKNIWLNASMCAAEMTALVQYLDAKERLETNGETKRFCGSLFNGIDTDFERLESVVEWQATVHKVLINIATPDKGFTLRGLLDLPTETLTWIASLSESTSKYWPADYELVTSLENVFPHNERPRGAVPIGTTVLSELAEYLTKISGALFKYAEALDGFFAQHTSALEAWQSSNRLQDYRTNRKAIDDNPVLTILGKRYEGLSTEFGPVSAVIEWADCCARQSCLPPSCMEWLLSPMAVNRSRTLRDITQHMNQYWMDLRGFLAGLSQYGNIDWLKWSGKTHPTLADIETRASKALDNLDSLVGWADFSRAVKDIQVAGVAEIGKLALEGQLSPDKIIVAFRFAFYHTIAKEIMKSNPELMQFSGLSHTEIRNRFIELDNEIIKLTGERCAFKIAKNPYAVGNGKGPVGTWTEDALLTNELSKQKRHIPIRQLLARAGNTLLALKPCFMMGPLSVAHYLIPGVHKFDLVVMDEASQLKPEEALGAIARGSQVIVVGDPNQLPPTSFFDTLTGAEVASEEEETPIDEAESILEVCSSIFQPVHRLRWHYRSQHHSLIAFSNRHFYKERPLIIFPSPHGAANGLGIRHHYVANGLYEGLRNRIEATRVADAVIDHFRKCPTESLGVVTLNISQRDLIEEELDKRLRVYPQAQDYLSSWKDDGYPFFIKNLENVQGDERDVIYISTTFGPNAAGKFNMQFGPINGQMGWRRLNVLFTRAKRRVELFTSIDPAQMRIDAATPRGVKALKDYIVYARDGLLESPEITTRDYDSDFEISVSEVIQRNGFEVVPQLGVAGFFIDLAVRNPNRAGEFIAGIECDGATYHSGLSVRDRDRLRQEVLERLGWKGKIYRIWSTDWFKNPRAQTEKLISFLNSVKGPTVTEAAKAPQEAPVIRTWEQVPIPVFVAPKEDSNELVIDIGDFVTYCFANDPDTQFSVQIIDGPSNPNEGLLNENTPIAKALLGLSVGDEDIMELPMGSNMFRVIDIQR